MATELLMPRLSDSMEEVTILRWLVAAGDAVAVGQPLAEIETDKATMTYEAEQAGVVLSLLAAEGAGVAVGAPIAVLGQTGETLPARPPVARALTTNGTDTTAPVLAARAKASPLARRLAAQAGIELIGLPGSGPQGRVIRADVERAIAATGPVTRPEAPAPAPATARGEARMEPLSATQRTIARRMAESRATVPDIELRREVDMSAAVALREELRAVCEPPPSLNDFVIRGVALALREFPRVNGAYRDGHFETFAHVNVGIAVAAADALLVPTIFDADTLPLRAIATQARELAARAREGRLTPAELAGGTFTISNLGMFGVDSFSAVINPPQAAILAVGAVRPRPVAGPDRAVVVRDTAVLTLACDHRILYGADGAHFLARVAELLEQPLALLLS